jgi:hypothetical protein
MERSGAAVGKVIKRSSEAVMAEAQSPRAKPWLKQRPCQLPWFPRLEQGLFRGSVAGLKFPLGVSGSGLESVWETLRCLKHPGLNSSFHWAQMARWKLQLPLTLLIFRSGTDIISQPLRTGEPQRLVQIQLLSLLSLGQSPSSTPGQLPWCLEGRSMWQLSIKQPTAHTILAKYFIQ